MTRRIVTRRRVLAVAGAVAGYVGVKLAWRLVRDVLGADEHAAARRRVAAADIQALLAVFPHRGSAAIVGAAALAGLPDEGSAGTVVGRLLRKLGVPADKLAAMTVEERRRLIAGHVSAEHIAGDTVPVEGWELARTEARLCALAYLAKD